MASIKGPDFSKKDRDVLLITLPDGNGGGFDVAILPPTKAIMDAITALASAIDDITQGNTAPEDFDMDMALDVCAKAMSRNTQYKGITAEMLNLIGFDIEDIGEFIAAYILYITALIESKN